MPQLEPKTLSIVDTPVAASVEGKSIEDGIIALTAVWLRTNPGWPAVASLARRFLTLIEAQE